MPFSLIDSSLDTNRNGRFDDEFLPPGGYSGSGQNAISVENKGGRNGARGPDFIELDARLAYPASRPAIVLSPTHHARPDVLRLMRAADFCYVGSLHDGMNLVSKEFVAARDDEQGVLVLSENAGASVELRQALIVDPRDTEQVAHALHEAITMSGPEQRHRMRQMRSTIAAWDARAWSTTILNSVVQASAEAFSPTVTAPVGASMRVVDRVSVGPRL